MHAAGEVLRSFQRAFHERRVDYHLVALTSVNSLLPRFRLLLHGLKVSLHTVDANEMKSISANDLECLASEHACDNISELWLL